MANFEYKNIDEILSTSGPIRGTRVSLQDNKLLEKVPISFKLIPSDPSFYNFEFHTFLPNGAFVSTVYNIQSWKVDGDNILLDIHRDLRKANNIPGIYKVVYNFLQNAVGGFSSPVKLFISDISSDRSELKLSLINANSTDGKNQLKEFVLNYLRPNEYIPSYVLNFGENKISNIINVTSDGSDHSLYVKLYEPLPADLDIFFECWIDEEFMRPYIDTVTYVGEEVDVPLNQLRGANFEVDVDYWTTTETEYKSWNDILSANVQTSQEILDRYISTNNLPVELNVNFREFVNFIFYSSAEDRINNFVYKMELIDRYNQDLILLDTYTGSISSNKIKIRGLRDKLITGFDNFEKWLYYETTGSNYYTSQLTSSIVPYPKYATTGSDYNIATKEGKYKFYTPTSSQVETWYNDVIDKATDYDLKNYNALNKAIPEYLRDDKDNEQFVTFVNMIGQHFDIMYLYTDHIVKKNLREEHPKDGMSQDLIYDVARNLGWTLSSGTQAKDLWEYALGVSGSGDPVWTGKVTTNKYLAKSEEERTKEVWRRILNNLPYIYKSKGTARGVTALLAAYGIPQTLLTIREYGGPDNADLGITPRSKWEKHTYYLNFSGSMSSPVRNNYVEIPWEQVKNDSDNWQYIDTLSFRWKMEPSQYYSYNGNENQTLLQKNSGSRVDWFVTVNKNGTDDDKGTLSFYIGDGTNYVSASIQDEYLYDDVPLNLMIRRGTTTDNTGSNQTYELFLKTAKYGKIAVERSASLSINGSTSGSYNRSWVSDGLLFIGSGSNPQTSNILSGSIFELRYWTRQLQESSFDNHTLSARSYNGNTETSSFYDLQGQFKFWQKFDIAVTTSISSSHPDQTKTNFYTSPKIATVYNFDSGSFESIVESYNMEVASLGNNTIYAEKVRIDSSFLAGGLSKDFRSEVSQFDRYSIDSDKLMIAFSPQSVINEDIYEALGGVRIDDYVGTYGNIYEDNYPELKWLARQYWKKYPNKNDFTAYLRLISKFDFSVFDQIRQTLPARTNPILGVVIEPNILERSKVAAAGKDLRGTTPNVYDFNEISSSASIKVDDYIEKVGTIKIEDSQDGDVHDIYDDIDLVVNIPATFQPKSASIQKPEPIPVILYSDNNTTIPISVNTNLDFSQKSSSIKIDEPNPIVSYEPHTATIQNLIDDVNIIYSQKSSSIKIDDPTPNIVYVPKNAIIGNLSNDVIVSYTQKSSSIQSIKHDLLSEYTNYDGKIDGNTIGNIKPVYNTINAGINNSLQTNILRSIGGSYNSIHDLGEIQISQTSTYLRYNVYKSSSVGDIGYGNGWSTIRNNSMKSTAYFETITGSRSDGFYKRVYLFYSSSIRLAAKDSYSSSYVASEYQSQHNLATSTRHQRFEGSKMVGPDVNVNSEQTLDGTPVVEVFVVDSKEIMYRTYSDGGNLSAI
jgi:hypothetical protein